MISETLVEGHFKIANLEDGAFDVLFFRQSGLSGGSVRAHPINTAANLKGFMESLGYPLSHEQLLDAEERRPIRATTETKLAWISSTSYERYFG